MNILGDGAVLTKPRRLSLAAFSCLPICKTAATIVPPLVTELRPTPWTPFDAAMPDKVPSKFWINSNAGRHYALYTLVHTSKDDINDVLHTVKFHAANGEPQWPHKIVRAPMHDFSSASKSLRDIYDYHTGLLDEEDRGFALSKFIVVADPNWEAEGVLIVDLDCHPVNRGTLGVLRVDIGALLHSLMMLEASNRNWTNLKNSELLAKWPGQIQGYTEARFQTGGYSYRDDSRFMIDASFVN